MRYFGLSLEDTYGTYLSKSTGEIYQRFEKASFGLKGEPVSLRLGSKDIQAARLGYAEPSGSTECTMDSKTIQYLLMAILGNYTHTTSGEKHVHEFYGGENTKLPSFNGDFVFDLARKKMNGLQADELKIDVKTDLITVATNWIYKTERSTALKYGNQLIADLEDQGLVTVSQYEQRTVDGIPYIGYDGTFKIGTNNTFGTGNVPDFVINDCSIGIKLNHNRDSARDVFHRMPTKKPTTGDRDLEITFTTTMDKVSYRLLLAAEYGIEVSNEELVTTNLLNPHACRFVTQPVELKFQTCEDATEYVQFKFPKCLLQAESIEVNGNDQITISFTLTPMGGQEVTLNDGSTKVTTAMYVIVVNDQPEIGYYTKPTETASPTSVNSPTSLLSPSLDRSAMNELQEAGDIVGETTEVEPQEETE